MIVYSHLLFCMDSTLETYMPRVKGFSIDFENFEFYEFWKVWSNYVLEFVNGVYETFRLVGQNVMYHHTIMCALHVLLKGILLINASQMEL